MLSLSACSVFVFGAGMAPEQAKHKGKERVAAAELGKRARISDAEPRPHAEPFLRADQSMLGQLQMNIKSSYEMIVGALERLPICKLLAPCLQQ